MLTGKITYKGNNKLFRYDVVGVDNSMALNLKLESGSWEAVNYLDGDTPDFTPDTLFQRQITINLSKVVVQRQVVLDSSTGKKLRAGVNTDFFCSLASTIRYMKHNCIKKNQEGYLGIALASGEFEPESTTTYKIPHETDDGIFGSVTLHLGDIWGMHIKTPVWEIDLDEDTGIALELFPAVKDGWSSGIAFNEEYLCFPVKKQVVKAVESNMGMYTCIEDIIAAHPDKEFTWLLGKDYQIVSDDNLEEVCKYIMSDEHEYVYYDTETTGLNITFKSRLGADQGDQLVGVVLSVKFGESFYFPLQMESIPNLCGGDHWYVMEHYMRPILEGKKLVAHNMSFDWKVAYIYDINCNIVHDTMALIKLTLGAERKNYPMGLKENTRLLLGRDSLELSDLVIDDSWGQSDITFKDLPYELVRLYACADTDNTNGLLQYAIQADLLAKYNAKKIYEIEIAFSYAVAYQEFYGHKINLDNLTTLRADIQKGLDENLAQMVKICGHDFNPNSPKELINIMYTELGIPEQISRKTGRITTDKETVKYLAELTDAEDNIKYPFCDYLLKYRTFEGVRKIIDKFPEHSTEDGYIFSSVMQYGTTTGRVSVNNPNYQSYNDPIKKNVVPRPGYWMSDSDYSSVEYRTLGSMVGNKRIMESFKDPDFDYHQYQAARMYGVPYSAVTKKMRKAAKGINFGLPYGMGDQSLGVRVFGEESPENTRKAAALRNAYFKGQEDIRDWFEYHRNRGVNEGFTETYFGRRRYYHKQDFSVNAIRRQAGNQVIQGTAADIYKTAVGRLFKRICKEGWLGKVLLTGFIHDEVLCEISNDINPMVWLRVLREEFEVKIDGWCPLYMGYGFGMSWYEAKSVELPIKLQWEFVEKYGENGYPDWDGDGRKFCDTIPDKLRDFAIRDIRNQLTDPESQGKEIKPALNNALLDIVKEDSQVYPDALSEYMQGDFNEVSDLGEQTYLSNVEDVICKWLDSNYHIQSLMKDTDGNFVTEFKPAKTTQEAIDQFCALHGVDRSTVNILDIPDATEGNVGGEDIDIEYYGEDDENEDNKLRLRDTKIDNLGFYLDTDENKIYFQLMPQQFLALIQQKCNKDGRGYRVYFKDNATKTMYETQAYLPSEDVRFAIDVCIHYLNTK